MVFFDPDGDLNNCDDYILYRFLSMIPFINIYPCLIATYGLLKLLSKIRIRFYKIE